MLPLAGAALSAVAILSFQGNWYVFFWPLIIMRDQPHWTLPFWFFVGFSGCRRGKGGRTGRR